MGRAPCCDKANVKKGPWSPEEDAKLKSYIEQHGTGGNWIALPQKIGLKRCGKSCRLRWLNYLRPNIKHGGFSEEEDNLICSLYISIGSRWSIIAAQLPGRTDNDIKNYWNTRLKKKLLGKQRKESRRGNNHQVKKPNHDHDPNLMASSSSSSMMSSPYWPELPILAPIPYSNNEEQRFNDHAAIRKFLIKLGGRFSDDDHVINDPTTVHHPQQFYEPQSLETQFAYNNIDGGTMQVVEGQNNLEIGDFVYNNGMGLLDATSSCSGFGDVINAPTYQDMMMVPDCNFSDFRYTGI